MCEKEYCDGNCDNKRCVGVGGKKCKGVKKTVVKNHITFDHYKDCLFENKTYNVTFNTLRSRKHEITTERITKVALSDNDDKRYIIPNDPEYRTLALGHWRAKHPVLYTFDINSKTLFEKGSLMSLAYDALG